MADSILRALRDGALEGELAPGLTIKDSILSPLGLHVIDHFLSHLSSLILAGKSQSRGLVLVAFSRSPSYYVELLKSSGIDDVVLPKWVRVLDCYSDPLGWKLRLKESGAVRNCPDSFVGVTVCRDVRNLDTLLSAVVELGKGLVGQGKDRFCVAIDSVTEMLRGVPLSSVARLLSSLRSHEQVSSTFWMLHSDIHDANTNAALEYMSSMVASVEEGNQLKSGEGNLDSLSLHERGVRKAKFRVRLKRRNGRVRLMSEDMCLEKSGIKFVPVSSEEESLAQTLLPKVQFNLQLSEKEQMDRSKVVLPFEHQEKDRANQIYDGRRSLLEGQNDMASEAEKLLPVTDNSGRGEIVYVRDSDDERPDSDEDPDDDLDI